MVKKIGFPVLNVGLDGQLSPHFGHVNAVTIIHYDEESNDIIKAESVNNIAHQQGGCMAPVSVLQNAGVSDVILGGIGMRPLMYFLQCGINPFQGISGTVKDNFTAFINNQLQPLTQGTCSGGNH